MVSAYSTVVDDNIPSPQGYSVPLGTISDTLLIPTKGGITFLTSNLFLPSAPVSAPDFAVLSVPFDFAGTEGPASGMSTSAMASCKVYGSLNGEMIVRRNALTVFFFEEWQRVGVMVKELIVQV